MRSMSVSRDAKKKLPGNSTGVKNNTNTNKHMLHYSSRDLYVHEGFVNDR